jgi:hypothetical protein
MTSGTMNPETMTSGITSSGTLTYGSMTRGMTYETMTSLIHLQHHNPKTHHPFYMCGDPKL